KEVVHMATVTITTRTTKRSGKRFVVRYRRGGRAYPVVHGGSFKTMKEAKVRRDLVAGELAAGRDPMRTLAALGTTPIARMYGRGSDVWLTSRVDLEKPSRETYRAAKKALPGWLLDKLPAEITFHDLQRAFAETNLAASTLHTYKVPMAQVFDFADV